MSELIKKHIQGQKSHKYVNFKQEKGFWYLQNIEVSGISDELSFFNVYNTEKDEFEPGMGFFPKQLHTRIKNMIANKEILKESILYIKYLGVKKSNKGRYMHSFYAEVLKQ